MVRVTLKPSLYLALLLTTAHVACAGLLIPLDMPFWVKLALAGLIAVSLTHSLRHHALRRSLSSFIAVEVREDDRAAVQTRDGEWHDARVLPTTYVSAVLTVINLRIPPRLLARHAVIVPDGIVAEDFRLLRVALRWRYRSPDGRIRADEARAAVR
jgi:toxin CptA